MSSAARRLFVVALAICLAGGPVPLSAWGAPPAKSGLGGLHFFSRNKKPASAETEAANERSSTDRGTTGKATIRPTEPAPKVATRPTTSLNPLRNALDRVTGQSRPQVGHALPAAPVGQDSPPAQPERMPPADVPSALTQSESDEEAIASDNAATVIDVPPPPGSDEEPLDLDDETKAHPAPTHSESNAAPHPSAGHSRKRDIDNPPADRDEAAPSPPRPKPLATTPIDDDAGEPGDASDDAPEEPVSEPVPPPRRIPTRTARVTDETRHRDVSFGVPTTPRMAEGAPVDHVPAGLTVDWQLEDDLSVGGTARATLTIRNTSGFEATDVVVRAVLAEALEFRQANLPPQRQGRVLLWTLPRVAPYATETIDLTVRAIQAGDAACVASVTSTQTSTRTGQIRQPVIQGTLTVPAAVIAGDSLTALLEVSNTGDGAARQVVADVELTEGLMHARGREFRLALGSLQAGESRTLRLPLAVVATGPQQVQVLTSARGAPARTATAPVQVLGARLQFDLVGPPRRLVERPATYALRLRNTSQAPVGGVTLRMQVAAGFDFASASDGGEWSPEERTITWQVADLGGGAATEVTTRLVARQPGLATHTADWTSEFGAGEALEAQTLVETAPRLEMEITDEADPIEVGSESEWRIVVRNDGSAPAQAVRLLLELPAGVRLVEAAGPTRWGADESLVAFAQIPQLKPGGRAVYTLRFVGERPGSLKLKAQVTATDLEPLDREESTRFYSDR